MHEQSSKKVLSKPLSPEDLLNASKALIKTKGIAFDHKNLPSWPTPYELCQLSLSLATKTSLQGTASGKAIWKNIIEAGLDFYRMSYAVIAKNDEIYATDLECYDAATEISKQIRENNELISNVEVMNRLNINKVSFMQQFEAFMTYVASCYEKDDQVKELANEILIKNEMPMRVYKAFSEYRKNMRSERAKRGAQTRSLRRIKTKKKKRNMEN